ncbi:MAG: FAD-dependent oxidoreductase [Bacteroidetes bacterium]|nr:FAD-dependent oxidoreductase [Bacteroidota bacterium]
MFTFTTMRKADYIIVGQGICGSVLALILMKRGRSVVVIDQPELSSSSKIAAGVFNPFNFRQMMNNWRAHEMHAAVKEIYSYAENSSGKKILTERRLLKIFTSADERKLWERACIEKQNLFADENIIDEKISEKINAPFGIGLVQGAGNVDCGMLLYVVNEKLKTENNLLEEKFEEEKVMFGNDDVVYDNRIAAKKIILCNGHFISQSKWFRGIPFKQSKGQLLHVHIPGFSTDDIFSRGCSLLPLGNELFILGSTFDNDAVNETSTENAIEELISKAKKFISAEIKVVSRYAGIRPAMQDRRPVIGIHTEISQLGILNGMGSKAVFLAPWLSEQLVLQMEEGKELPVEVSVGRFL